MKKSDSPQKSISDRIKELMELNKVKAYKVCKETGIPEGTFSRSIKTQDTWKIQHLEKLSEYFMVSLDYLISGNTNHINEKVLRDYDKLKIEVLYLREKISTYEIAAKSIIKESSKKSKLKTT